MWETGCKVQTQSSGTLGQELPQDQASKQLRPGPARPAESRAAICGHHQPGYIYDLGCDALEKELAEDKPPEDGGTAKSDRGAKQRSRRRKEYEFTRWEERIMEVVMEAMRMAGLALGLQASSSVAVGAPGWARVSMV